jgi:hypothetical protein
VFDEAQSGRGPAICSIPTWERSRSRGIENGRWLYQLNPDAVPFIDRRGALIAGHELGAVTRRSRRN